jgi:hypothetical protein
MSAQQWVLCCTDGGISPGTIGVNAARLTASIANNSRTVILIGIFYHTEGLSKLDCCFEQTRQLNATFDAGSNLCYPGLDAQQNHRFDVGCRRLRGFAGESFGATMHPRQRIERRGLSVELLHKQNVLCDIAKEYRSSCSATR